MTWQLCPRNRIRNDFVPPFGQTAGSPFKTIRDAQFVAEKPQHVQKLASGVTATGERLRRSTAARPSSLCFNIAATCPTSLEVENSPADTECRFPARNAKREGPWCTMIGIAGRRSRCGRCTLKGSIDGGTGDAEEFRDLCGGVYPVPVQADELSFLCLGEFRLLPPEPALRLRYGHLPVFWRG